MIVTASTDGFQFAAPWDRSALGPIQDLVQFPVALIGNAQGGTG